MMNYLITVPDEIYKLIMSYVFLPKVSLRRMESIYTWNTELLINKCFICKQSAKCVGLSYNCGCNISEEEPYNYHSAKCKDGCKNQLICFNCAH